MTTLSLLLKVTLILGAALAATWIARRSRASLRHLLLAASFAMLLALPAATLVSPTVGVAVPSGLEGALEPLTLQPIGLPDEPPVPPSVAILPSPRPGWEWPSRGELLLGAWLAGVALFMLPVIVGLRQVAALRRTGLPWPSGQALVDDLSARTLFRRRRVELLLTEAVPGPMTCGVIRPAILLPVAAATWSPADLSRAIVHELEHVRRFDWLSQCLTRVVASAYWFHPLVWVAWRRFALEAERACDDAVLASETTNDDTAYADQLIDLAQRLRASSTQIHLAMANRRDLSSRIAAVLDRGQRRGRAGHATVLVASSIAAATLLVISPLQIALSGRSLRNAGGDLGQQRFEVASIKPCKSEEDLQPGRARGAAGGTNAAISPGRFTVPCVTLEQLIYLAHASYGARENERLENDYMGEASNSTKVRGGPDWAHSHRDKWAIEATAPGVTDRYVLMGTMLRTLLEERFKLKIHRETESVPMYALRLAKGGLKMKALSEGECEGRRREEQAAKGVEPCGRTLRSGGVAARLHFVGFGLGFLARAIANETGLHVIDETGVTGDFIIDLQYVSEQIAGSATADPNAAASLPGGGATLFTALEQQLGLKLEKVQGRRAYIVIDHAERPAFAQATARPRYDVASIKQCEAEEIPTGARGTAGGTNATISPGRFYVPCVTTEQLIYLAYASYGVNQGEGLVNDDPGSASNSTKVRGGPDWVHSLREKYRIEATAEGATERTVLMGTMLQTLLEERFKLKLHRETEEVAMFKLVVGKGGFKLKPMKEGDCTPGDGPIDMQAAMQAATPRCGNIMMTGGPGINRWTFGGYKISQLANMLTRSAGAHVIDATGLTDQYVFRFEFARENGMATGASPAPDLNTALQDQLGLRLEPTRGPRGYLVIDHIELPTPDAPTAPPLRATGAARRD